MTRASPEQAVIEAIVAVRPALRPADVHLDSSLTLDLGLDSLDLVQFATRITVEYPDFDLREWLAEAMSSEADSVRSVVNRLVPSAQEAIR